MFGASDFKRLVAHIDGFSLMTYDYSQPGRYMCIANVCAIYHRVGRLYKYGHSPTCNTLQKPTNLITDTGSRFLSYINVIFG